MYMSKDKLRSLILLHLMLMIYSVSGVCSKNASTETFLSFKFCVYYGGVILLLAFYAICWQQIIKKLPLTTAYANKAITIAWGLVWGRLFFQETITVGKVGGIALVVVGIVVFAVADGKE